MKSVKIVFGFASIALLLAVGCFLAFLFLPGNMTEKNDVREEDSFVSMEPLTAEEQAKIEIERFRTDYGCEITMDEMLLQLKIRAEYEETYHMSYPLEEVFLAEEDKDLSFGDAGDVSYTDTIEKIQKYIEMYNIDDSTFKRNLDAYVSMLEMESFLHQPVRQLSLGQRMRADLAASLLHDPSILFLDEPTIGVDVVAKERLRQFILDVNQKRGVTALLTTHDMVDMEKLVSRVIVIGCGQLVYDGTIQGLRDKYGQTRRIDITFAETDPQIHINGLTEVAHDAFHRSYTFNQSELSASRALSLLTNQPYTIRDIAIQEADIEEVIRNLYTSKGGDSK